jgi:DEAD/DEAH box helicase domain-containing protein
MRLARKRLTSQLVYHLRELRLNNALSFLLNLSTDEDPVQLLKDAGRQFVPMDPSPPLASGTPTPTKSEVKLSSMIRLPIDKILQEVQTESWYKDQVLYRRTFEPQLARHGTLDPPISKVISQALLDSRKINTFYSHQAEAIQEVRAGRNVVVSTSTASGKSLIYQVPLLEALERDPSATAIFVYPTKVRAMQSGAAIAIAHSNGPGIGSRSESLSGAVDLFLRRPESFGGSHV